MELYIRPEQKVDHYQVEELTREAFWQFWEPQRKICDEHLLVHKLRKTATLIPELNLVAVHEDRIVGHIIYSKSKIVATNGLTYETLIFGPLSVLPQFQNQGIGRRLLNHSFKIARDMGFRAIIIFGVPDYYPRIGFKRATDFGLLSHTGRAPDAFLAYPLYEDALAGLQGHYHYDPVYDQLNEDEALEFDKRFPAKEFFRPTDIEVLLKRLTPSARHAVESLNGSSLQYLTSKSQREIASLPGIDLIAIETIKQVMAENNMLWGEK